MIPRKTLFRIGILNSTDRQTMRSCRCSAVCTCCLMPDFLGKYQLVCVSNERLDFVLFCFVRNEQGHDSSRHNLAFKRRGINCLAPPFFLAPSVVHVFALLYSMHDLVGVDGR